MAEVAALREKMAGAGRFAVQEALMPYDRLLPGAPARRTSGSTSAMRLIAP